MAEQAPCPLTQGFSYVCDDSAGGIKQGSILIAAWQNITANTVTAGEVTALTQATSTSFYRYEVKKNIAGAVTTENHDPLVGTTFEETVMSFMLNKLSNTKNVELKLLTSNPVVVIYQDLNDIYHVMGLDNGAEKMGGTNGSQTGTAFADQNGYQLAFTSQEKNYPYTVDATVVSGLTIA